MADEKKGGGGNSNEKTRPQHVFKKFEPSRVDNLSLDCSHYDKKCSRFSFSCCSMVKDPCHRCHLERGAVGCAVTGAMITSIVCNECDFEQTPTSQNCQNCGVQFSRSFCPTCKIWTAKLISHCNDCGMCRVIFNPSDRLVHCHSCDLCFFESANHSCTSRSLKHDTCPVCQVSFLFLFLLLLHSL